jgi:hypothetical protein
MANQDQNRDRRTMDDPDPDTSQTAGQSTSSIDDDMIDMSNELEKDTE